MIIRSLPLLSNLYIKNLAIVEPHTAFLELHKAFSGHGHVYSIKLHLNEDKSIKEYAYIQFDSKDSAELAKNNLDGSEILGKKITVEIFRKNYTKPVPGELNNLFV